MIWETDMVHPSPCNDLEVTGFASPRCVYLSHGKFKSYASQFCVGTQSAGRRAGACVSARTDIHNHHVFNDIMGKVSQHNDGRQWWRLAASSTFYRSFPHARTLKPCSAEHLEPLADPALPPCSCPCRSASFVFGILGSL